MAPKERILATYAKQEIDKIVWQPRLEIWYKVNKMKGTLPNNYKNMDLLEIYDDLNASPRGYIYFRDTVKCIEGDKVKVQIHEDEEYKVTKYVTPKGELKEVIKYNIPGAEGRRMEYMVKSLDDFEVLKYILENQKFYFDKELYDEMVEKVGNRTEPVINVPWMPFQRFNLIYAGFENATILLWKYREKVEELFKCIEENDDKRLDVIKKCPIKIVMFGDNIDEGLISPPIFLKYVLPYYKKRTKELHAYGKICQSHWDGHIKRFLPYIKETGLDALEAVPVLPQGNVSIEELRNAMKGMILVDGIPAILFLPTVDNKELRRFTFELLDAFAPNIILGISDLLPVNGDIEKVRFIGEILMDYSPKRK
jgi:hypothetical protein